MRVSIVICTDDRGEAITSTLRSLEKLDGPVFEVCVVCGPNDAGTALALEPWRRKIKIAKTDQRNLSVSRNIGIAMAAGDVVAFIDDDALPESGWLQKVHAGFDAPEVGGVGGIVLDHTGTTPQYLLSCADRLGRAETLSLTPFTHYNFPLSFRFPYLQGTNCAFRRDALLSIRGFDEEFEYFLDETDVCCRLNDNGWTLRQILDAVVHHKFLPSAIRNAERVTVSRYAIMKNKLYFSLQNNRGHYPAVVAHEDMSAFVRSNEQALRKHIRRGDIPASALDTFAADADRAWQVGLERGQGTRKLMTPETLDRYAAEFQEFPRATTGAGRETHLFVSFNEAWDRAEALEVSARGHHVHLLQLGEGHDRIDFENGIWIYRFVPRFVCRLRHGSRPAAVLAGLRQVRRRTDITAIRAARGDAEASAFLAKHC